MAASAISAPSMMATSMTRVGHSVRTPSMYFLTHKQRASRMPVCCMSSNDNNQDDQKVQKKQSTKFVDLLAFSGPAPERINGRLAMLGFVAAIGAELARGNNDVVAQLGNGGLSWFVATSILFSFASLVPLFKGVSAESKSDGVMTSNAELWNGRFAMLGLVALVFTEFVKGGPLV